VGLLPCNFVTVRAGETLTRMRTLNDMYSWETTGLLLALVCLALIPVAWRRYQEKQPGVMEKP
jgi:hypothetical protein